MTYRQIKDIVAWMQQVHRQLQFRLDEPIVTDSRTQSILLALRREERELQVILARYHAQGEGAILETWLQYVPDDDVCATLAAVEFSSEMSPDEIVVRKLKIDQALATLLGQLAEETSVPRIQEFFRNLREHVESRMARQAWRVCEYQGSETPPTLEL
ncbi:MAG: hypothetical protein KF861_10570 [Planctomycetaceae bacterium]|nr:hypothetical protein [Planctomycetaceae bacterium]